MSSLDEIHIIKFKDITLDDVLKYCNETTWKEGGVAKSRYSLEKGSAINKNIRDADIADMPSSFYEQIDNAMDPHIKKYAKDNGIEISKNTAYIVTRYLKGQFFTEHVDSTEEFPRKVSAILYLNDNYSGGTLTFTKFNKSFKPSEGSLFIFPSSKEFSHSADPVIDGVKYVVVGFWE
jgi:Rps23 Pro-64 3,4-dihydroxylase Tpa1-like proline 4-hydroxylase